MSAPSLTPILQAVDVARQVVYGGDTLTILRGVNMTVATGDGGDCGSSGSGKSTLLGILAGLDHASNGQVLLFGKSLSHLSGTSAPSCASGWWALCFSRFSCCRR